MLIKIFHKLGKKVFSFAAKPARNDLSKCAVFLLFTEYVKDKAGNILSAVGDLNKLYQISVSDDVDKGLQFYFALGDLVIDKIDKIPAGKYATGLWKFQSNLWGFGMKTQEYKNFVKENSEHFYSALFGTGFTELIESQEYFWEDLIDLAWGVSTFFRTGEEYKN